MTADPPSEDLDREERDNSTEVELLWFRLVLVREMASRQN